MIEKRIDITERQDEYLERVLGDYGKSDAEMFRALIRKHRQMRRLLKLDEYDDVPDEQSLACGRGTEPTFSRRVGR